MKKDKSKGNESKRIDVKGKKKIQHKNTVFFLKEILKEVMTQLKINQSLQIQPLRIVGENAEGLNHREDIVWKFLKRLKIELQCDSATYFWIFT